MMQLTQQTQIMTTRRTTDDAKAIAAFTTDKFQIGVLLDRRKALSEGHFETLSDKINRGHLGTLNHPASLLRQITQAPSRRANMPLDPPQRHQIEQDAITAAQESERLVACDH